MKATHTIAIWIDGSNDKRVFTVALPEPKPTHDKSASDIQSERNRAIDMAVADKVRYAVHELPSTRDRHISKFLEQETARLAKQFDKRIKMIRGK